VSLPVFAGLLVRAIPVLTAGFPLNDGGLFFTMTRDLQQANFLLPATTSYNGLDIPFAYPPLAFYVAGGLSSIFGIPLIDVFRFLPMLVATAMIPVVYVLARELLASRFQELLATWAFAFLPRSFDWLIAGGGVTRSIGLLLALLTIIEGIRFYRDRNGRHGIAMGVLAGLTALSHPQAALFTAVTMLVILLVYRRNLRAVGESVLLAGLAAVIAAPWWVTVAAVHGFAPLVSGGQSGTDLGATFQHLLTFTFTDEPYTTFLAVIGLIGLLRQLSTGRYLLPAWLLLVFIADSRGAATELMAPLALLIAVAIDEVLLRRDPAQTVDPGDPVFPRALRRDRFAVLVLSVGLLLGIIGGAKANGVIASPLQPLSAPNRAAMAWIADNAPPSANFVVVTGNFWFVDSASEWFPVLAGHRSLATLQGYEWLGNDRWLDQADRFYALQTCAHEGARCFAKWTATNHAQDAWVYAPSAAADSLPPASECCKGFREALEDTAAYELVYSGPGGDVFRPRSAG
jgi:hypothetical protein